MDGNDQRAIAGLFEKLADVERQSPPRDSEAESYIRGEIARQPGAPYYMAQTIVVQEQALNAAQARIEELEMAASQPASGGGLLGALFGSPQPRRTARSVPSIGRAVQQAAYGQQQNAYAQAGQQQQRAGGGFLAGAAQTAMGVAGGMLLASAVSGMFGADEAQAAESPPADDAGMDDPGFDGGDLGDF